MKENSYKPTESVLVSLIKDSSIHPVATTTTDLAEGLGIVDHRNALVVVGGYVRNDRTGSVHQIIGMHVYEAREEPGMATVCFSAEAKGKFDIHLSVVDGVIHGSSEQYSVVEFKEADPVSERR